jgi:hypothetical protein
MLTLIRCMGAMQVLTLLLLLLASLRSSAAPPPSGYRSTLTHVDSHGGLTKALLYIGLFKNVYKLGRQSRQAPFRPSRVPHGARHWDATSAIHRPGRYRQRPHLDTMQAVQALIPARHSHLRTATSSSFSPVPCSSATCLPIWSSCCSTPTVVLLVAEGRLRRPPAQVPLLPRGNPTSFLARASPASALHLLLPGRRTTYAAPVPSPCSCSNS